MSPLIASIVLAAASATPVSAAPAQPLADAFREPAAEQVRVERRLIIRVAPVGPGRDVLADLPAEPGATPVRERAVGRCLPAADIAGVEIGSDDRLLLRMRDRRLIGANLEKACQARDFYSGFYVARSRDGLVCVGRDTLRSRTGASCAMSRLRQLVARGD